MGIKGKCKYSEEEIRNAFAAKQYEIVDDAPITSSGQKIKYICSKHKDKGIQSITYGHLKDNKGCYYCGREKTINSRKYDISSDEFIEKATELCNRHNFVYTGAIRENGNIYIKFICKQHEVLGEQKMQFNNMNRNLKGCKYCSGKQLPEWYVLEQIKKINPHVELIDPFINLTTRIRCKCLKHNIYMNQTVQEILNGHGCYYCGLEKLSAQMFLTHDEFIDKYAKINPHLNIISNYSGSHGVMKVQCKECLYEFEIPTSSLYHKIMCKRCKGYLNEVKINGLLTEWGIRFKSQYRFNDCRDARPLPFDFGIFDYNNNIVGVVEYDVELHYRTLNKLSNEKSLKNLHTTQAHDIIKNKYCQKNKIPLLRIPYFQKEDIPYLLFDFLVELKLIQEITP